MLRIHNSLSGKKEVFKPILSPKVKIYVCGMTVYDYCHIGHARVLVVFDIVTRYLRWRDYDVTYVRNVTDVDDKIIARATENGEDMRALTTRFIKAMHEDAEALGVLPPDQEPLATEYMDDIIHMVSTLIDKGFAYSAPNNDVYYQVRKFDAYGKLARETLDDQRAGARVDVNSNKKDPLDFVLWKAAKEGEPAWDSPWGRGRPGWHIECSAMSTRCLGNHFDIHGGGMDLKFPHHENEIAQSEAATGESFVNVWMHNGFVQIDDEKMSKSLGNFFTVREVLKQYRPEVIRYFIISSHYRSPLNYATENLELATGALERFYLALRDVDLTVSSSVSEQDAHFTSRFIEAMNDDFNTPEALSVLFDLVRELNRAKIADDKNKQQSLAIMLRQLAEPLGILQGEPDAFLKGERRSGEDALSDADIDELVTQRNTARSTRNWVESDRIRDQLTELGITLEDNASGTRWRKG
ncbi:MAG: cysteine--tRNA ligase [Gammaproteobacteria bacterium]|nr:cysteine--tRNA ligase [Gammaproteobacteria bacterium]